MGHDDMSVVHPGTMQVHGMDGLCIVDASVMPSITNGNIYAPVMMLAEKASDLILRKEPLPAEKIDFYVAPEGSNQCDSNHRDGTLGGGE